MTQLTFLGAAGEVTGSCYLVDTGEVKFLIECGMFQGGRSAGRRNRRFAFAPQEIAFVLLVESTYGNRSHKSRVQTLDEFAYALTDTIASRRGNVVIPAFAVGRTQDILYLMSELTRDGRIPAMDVYVDSPMALAATRITLAHPELHDRETTRMAEWMQSRSGGPRMKFTESVEESMRINSVRSGAAIISASGMCDGGRVKHHLRYNISRPECSIVFVGFQAAGTLGRRIVDGAKTVRIFGEPYAVRAKVFTIGGLSAHADRPALLGWLGHFKRAPRQTWIVHGEPPAAHALRDEIRRKGWRAEVPSPGQTIEIA